MIAVVVGNAIACVVVGVVEYEFCCVLVVLFFALLVLLVLLS